MDLIHALVIAVVQGATELFPVSSLGHAVILPALLGWSEDIRAASFLPFLVMLHVGTAVALLGYFWRDWLAILTGIFGTGGAHQVRESRRVALLIVLATIPAVIVGGLLRHSLEALFSSPIAAAGFLLLNGIMLLLGERLRGGGHRPLSDLKMADAVAIGIWQCGALLPGISRSGATIVGALLRGIDHEGAAHFSFLIATPIILGATVLEVPKLLHADMPPGTLQTAAIAAVVAGLVALASTAFLMRWFRRGDERRAGGEGSWALAPFGWYCVVVGGAMAAYFGLM